MFRADVIDATNYKTKQPTNLEIESNMFSESTAPENDNSVKISIIQ